jgi:DNA polymerase-3 subunit delta'
MESNLKPWQNKSFYGHHKIIDQLNKIKQSNSINNSLLFYGDYGLGKSTLAFRYTNFLLSKNQGTFQNFKIVENDDTFGQLSKLSSPNVHYISDLDENDNLNEIKIDIIRELKNKLQTKTFNKTQRVVIIDSADSLNKSSSNALLKLLEEPPNQTLIIIISHNIKNLPDTILSRCIKFHFKNLEDNEISQVLNNSNIYIDLSKIKNTYSNSVTPGKVIHLHKHNFYNILNDFNDLKSADDKDIHSSALIILKKYSPKESHQSFIIFFEIFMLWIKQNAINLLDNIPTNLNLLKLIKIWDKYNKKYIDLNTYNLNKDEFLLSICYELQKIKNDIK